MKTAILLFLLPFLLLAADVKIPVQGFLVDSEGKNINGYKSLTFSLYNSENSSDLLWTETVSIDVKESLFSHLLGTVEYLDSALIENDLPLFLEINVDSEKLTPRIELGAESKAIFSYNSGKFDGKTFNEAKKAIKDEVKSEISETDLSSILSRLDSLETKVTSLQTENSNLLTQIGTLETNITTLTSKVNTLETKVNSLESNVETLQSDNSTLTTKVNTLETNSFDGDYNSLTNKPTLHLVATTGSYSDLSGLPSLFDGDYNTLINKPVLATVATTGSYLDLGDKPTTITQEQADLIISNSSDIINLGTEIDSLDTRATDLETKTASISFITDNGQPTVRFTNVNVQIVSGLGIDNSSINGRGNLIVGYNAAKTTNSDKSGSHNLIIGDYHNYGSYNGFISGYNNSITAPFASIISGWGNTASDVYAMIINGTNNKATARAATVFNGNSNEANGEYSLMFTGSYNKTIGNYSVITSGRNNTTNNLHSLISGGYTNQTNGDYAIVLSGSNNNASGGYSTVSAGRYGVASGDYSSVSGGRSNTSSGYESSVSGGNGRTASGNNDWVAGALTQDY